MKKIVAILLYASLIGIVGCNKNTTNLSDSNVSEGTIISEIIVRDTYSVATAGTIPENICVKFVVSGEIDTVIREYNSSELREDPMAAQATDMETQST